MPSLRIARPCINVMVMSLYNTCPDTDVSMTSMDSPRTCALVDTSPHAILRFWPLCLSGFAHIWWPRPAVPPRDCCQHVITTHSVLQCCQWSVCCDYSPGGTTTIAACLLHRVWSSSGIRYPVPGQWWSGEYTSITSTRIDVICPADLCPAHSQPGIRWWHDHTHTSRPVSICTASVWTCISVTQALVTLSSPIPYL